MAKRLGALAGRRINESCVIPIFRSSFFIQYSRGAPSHHPLLLTLQDRVFILFFFIEIFQLSSRLIFATLWAVWQLAWEAKGKAAVLFMIWQGDFRTFKNHYVIRRVMGTNMNESCVNLCLLPPRCSCIMSKKESQLQQRSQPLHRTSTLSLSLVSHVSDMKKINGSELWH